MRGCMTKPRTIGAMITGVLMMVWTGSAAQAQRPDCYRPIPPDCRPAPFPTLPPSAGASTTTPGTTSPTAPATEQPQAAATPEPALGGERGGATGGENVALATPSMIGDLLGPIAHIKQPSSQNATRNAGVAPLIARGAFKIAENESPRPQDRILFDYNYFSDVGERFGLGGSDIHRETIGFEKTFLNGDASIGMRLPFFETAGDGSIRADGIGDLSVILKYAVINDRQTGDVLSGGIVVTAPTARDSLFTFGNEVIHSTILQPYVGFIWNSDNLFVHGFSAVAVPTDSRDVTLLFNDVGVGYYVYKSQNQDDLIRAISPTLEGHITTPLDHRNSSTDPFTIPDIVVLTAGTHIGFTHGSSLLIGAATPITGPKPYDFEAIVELNIRF